MAAEVKKEIQLEIAHVLFIDVVAYSKLSINEQNAAVDELTKIVRATERFSKSRGVVGTALVAFNFLSILVIYTYLK